MQSRPIALLPVCANYSPAKTLDRLDKRMASAAGSLSSDHLRCILGLGSVYLGAPAVEAHVCDGMS